MPQQQTNGGASVLLVFMAGAAVGAAVALLFAPAAGTDTREAVSRRAREGRARMLAALRQGRGIIDARTADVMTAFERARQEAQAAGEPERHA